MLLLESLSAHSPNMSDIISFACVLAKGKIVKGNVVGMKWEMRSRDEKTIKTVILHIIGAVSAVS